MRRRGIWGGSPAAVRLLAAGLLLGAFAAGCSSQPAVTRGSVQSCIAAGVAAVRHHVTLSSLPPACQGLTRAQVSFAVGSALHSAAIGAQGKAAQRARIGAASRYLKHLVVNVPAAPSRQPAPVSASPGTSGTALGLAALGAWLITIALGLQMLISWILAGRRSGRRRRPSALKLTHLGLAVVSLLTWIAYLGTGTAGLAWAACALLAVATGFGMALVFLLAAASPGRRAGGQVLPAPTAPTAGETQGDPPRGGPGRRLPVIVTVGAHIAFAMLTIALAVLAVAA